MGSMAERNINIIQGASFSLDISVTDVNGSAVNLTDYSGYSAIRNRAGDTGILTEFLLTWTNRPNGLINISLPSSGTAALKVNQAVYDLDLYSPANVVSKALYGYANIYPASGPIDSSGITVSISTPIDTGAFVTRDEWAAMSGYFQDEIDNIEVSGGGGGTGDYLPYDSGQYITALHQWTGASTGLYYPRVGNPSGFLISLSGTGALTGAFYPLSANPANYTTAAALSSASGILQGQISSIASWTGNTTGLFYPRFANPSGYITGVDLSSYATIGLVTGASGVLSAKIDASGAYIISLINAASAGVSSLNGQSGVLNLVGLGNITITTGAGTVRVSGDTGAYASFVTTGQTGNFVTSTSGDVTVQGGATIRNGQLLIGASGNNAFEQGNLYGSTGIVIISGSGMLGVAIDPNQMVTSLTQGANILITNNGNGSFTISSTASGSGINTGVLTGYFYPRFENPNQYVSGNSGVLYVDDVSGILNGQLLIGSTGDNAFIQGHLIGVSGIVVQSGSGSLTIAYTGAVGGVTFADLTGASGTLVSRIDSTGAYIISLISAASAGVSAVNGKSGILTLGGLGSVSVTTGAAGNIFISGDTGAYADFVTRSESGQFYPTSNPNAYITSSALAPITTWTGGSTGLYYPRGTNPSGYLVSADLSSYATIAYVNNISGVLDVRLFNTGLNLQSQISSLGVWTGASTGLYYPRSTNPSGYLVSADLSAYATTASVNSVSGALNTRLVSTGSNLQTQISAIGTWTGASTGLYYPRGTNPSGYLVAADLSAYATISLVSTASGTLQTQITSLTNWTGASTGIYVLRSESGQFASVLLVNNTSGALNTRIFNTGANLQGQIDAITAATGGFQGSGTQVRVVGGSVLASANLTGTNGVSVFTGVSGQVVFSGENLVTSTSGNVTVQGGATISDGQLLIGSSGANAFEQASLTQLTGIILVPGSGSLGIGIDVTKVVTGIFAGTNVSITPNGAGGFTINSTASGGTGSANTGELTGIFYPRYANPNGYASGQSGTLIVPNASGIQNGMLLIGSSGDDAFISGVLAGNNGISIAVGSGTITIGFTGSVTGGSGASISVTGQNLSSANFTGGGNVSVSVVGDSTVLISGDTSAYSTFATASNLAATGANLQSQIDGLSSPGGLTWGVITGSSSAAVNNGYIVNCATGLCHIQLPTTGAIGSIIRVTSISASGWRITQQSQGIIYFGNATTTAGANGYLQSSHGRDAVELLCVTNSGWNVISSIGNLFVS